MGNLRGKTYNPSQLWKHGSLFVFCLSLSRIGEGEKCSRSSLSPYLHVKHFPHVITISSLMPVMGIYCDVRKCVAPTMELILAEAAVVHSGRGKQNTAWQHPIRSRRICVYSKRSAFFAAIGVGICAATVDRVVLASQVRLENVENKKLQDGIRAAVSGRFREAERFFMELLEEDEKSASVWSNLGNVQVSLGEYEQAMRDYTRAIELAPQAPVPRLNRAIAYEAVGRYQDAISDCKSAIEIDPKESAAWYNLGNAEMKTKDYQSAAISYERAATLSPGIAGYRLKQATVLFQLKKFEEAKKLIQGLVRKYPNYIEAHAALAAVLWKAEQRSAAENEFIQATIEEPKFKDIRWIENTFEWSPELVKAMEEFLTITPSK